jgi:carbonic anhydrase
MIEICWRLDPRESATERQPSTADDALTLLRDGNRSFAGLELISGEVSRHVIHVVAEDLGFGASPTAAPHQAPFAALLGCADARVPLELVFAQSANDAFTVRVAGNVFATECIGSFDYAVAHIPTIRLLGVVGHTGCGAVGAAVGAYLDIGDYLGVAGNLALRAIIDEIMAAVRGADEALRHRYGVDVYRRPGYRAALTEVAVVLNAAFVADAVQRMFASRLGETLGVAFGVYDLASRKVGLPGAHADGGWRAGLMPPPADAFPSFMDDVVGSERIESMLAAEVASDH